MMGSLEGMLMLGYATTMEVIMAVVLHLHRAISPQEFVSMGWGYTRPNYSETHHVIIGRHATEALTRLEIVGESGCELIKSCSLEDVLVSSQGRLQAGTYDFKGITVRIRVPGQPGSGFVFSLAREGHLSSFIELLKLMEDTNFSTDWLKRFERRPVTEWEALRRPTLAERLTQRRQMMRPTR